MVGSASTASTSDSYVARRSPVSAAPAGAADEIGTRSASATAATPEDMRKRRRSMPAEVGNKRRLDLLLGDWRHHRNRPKPLQALVLRAADPQPPVGELARVVHDLAEAHDGDDVVGRHRSPVDLLEEVLHLVLAAELGVVVLDVARREVLETLDLDLIDDRLEDLLSRRVLVADRHQHGLVLLVLVGLVAEPDRGRLAAALELVGEDRRVEVQDLHAGWTLARATISRSPRYVSASAASCRGIQRSCSTSTGSPPGSPETCSKRKNETILAILRPSRWHQ